MALIDFYNTLTIIRETYEEDEFGSCTAKAQVVKTFQGAITVGTLAMKELGDQDMSETVGTLTTSKEEPVLFNDIIKDEKGDNYRVVSDSKETPRSAGLNIKQYTVRKIKV